MSLQYDATCYLYEKNETALWRPSAEPLRQHLKQVIPCLRLVSSILVTQSLRSSFVGYGMQSKVWMVDEVDEVTSYDMRRPLSLGQLELPRLCMTRKASDNEDDF